jgi:hypothetical protein
MWCTHQVPFKIRNDCRGRLTHCKRSERLPPCRRRREDHPPQGSIKIRHDCLAALRRGVLRVVVARRWPRGSDRRSVCVPVFSALNFGSVPGSRARRRAPSRGGHRQGCLRRHLGHALHAWRTQGSHKPASKQPDCSTHAADSEGHNHIKRRPSRFCTAGANAATTVPNITFDHHVGIRHDLQ